MGKGYALKYYRLRTVIMDSKIKYPTYRASCSHSADAFIMTLKWFMSDIIVLKHAVREWKAWAYQFCPYQWSGKGWLTHPIRASR